MAAAGREQSGFVGEVAVHGRAPNARTLGDRADGRAGRADAAVQLHGALRDAAPGLRLELGAPLLLVASLFDGHWCPTNLDRSGRPVVDIHATLLSRQRRESENGSDRSKGDRTARRQVRV